MALAIALVPPAALHAALAAAAGTLFEAAPFVLAARLLPRRFAPLAALGGCGCRSGPLPGALALPAAGLCWLAFGWPIALARCVAAVVGLAIVGRRRRMRGTPDVEADAELEAPLTTLAGLVPFALGAALVRAAFVPQSGWLHARVAWPLEALAGAALGSLVPCATAAVAVAAGTHGISAPFAGGILATAGIVVWRGGSLPRSRRGDGTSERPSVAGTRVAYAILAAILADIAVQAPSGFVNPRLLPAIAVGAAAAAARAATARLAERHAWRAIGAIGAAIVLGAPAPVDVADATTLEAASAGERLAFTGRLHHRGSRAILERSLITCCRIDAQVRAVALATDVRMPDGSWLAAAGTLVRAPDGTLLLQPQSIAPVRTPRDPFAYR
ncbi:MAG: hypothetical protein NVSMB59_08610 [Vulcanimicrobiaceae bacterium]